MNLKTLASQVPPARRKIMLEENWISLSKPNLNCPYLKKLFVYYYSYISPNEAFDKDSRTGEYVMGCPTCVERYWSTFRSLLKFFVELEKEQNILNGL